MISYTCQRMFRVQCHKTHINSGVNKVNVWLSLTTKHQQALKSMEPR